MKKKRKSFVLPSETKPPEPFRFFTRLNLQQLTGLKARNVKELLEYIKVVPGSVIYHHTHHFLQQHQYLSPEPPNDFAYWVRQALNERELGEKLESINVSDFSTIRGLRDQISETIENYLAKSKKHLNEAREGQEFYFIKSISFVFPTPHVASNLEEFVAVLRKITVDSIYYHMFEATLRLEKGVNDFSHWFETTLGEKELAKKIVRLDPYTYTMEGLREKIIKLIENRLAKKAL